MVTVTNYVVRKNKEGKEFITLELSGDMEMIQSSATGKFYATVRKCSIPCTFPEEMAKAMVGRNMPGKIVRRESAPYEYRSKDTGEVLQLAYTYEYVPYDDLASSKEPAVPHFANSI